MGKRIIIAMIGTLALSLPGSTNTNLSSKNMKLMQGAGAVSGKTAAGFNRGIGQPPP
jgi:hypothetical protein